VNRKTQSLWIGYHVNSEWLHLSKVHSEGRYLKDLQCHVSLSWF